MAFQHNQLSILLRNYHGTRKEWDGRPARLFCFKGDGRDARPTLLFSAESTFNKSEIDPLDRVPRTLENGGQYRPT